MPSADPRPTPSHAALSVAALADGVRGRDRALLGLAISLIESTRPGDESRAAELLALLARETGGSTRVGITGVPGAGKSTFIERCGVMLCRQGRRVAVLAIDPSSSVSGGSILADRTRMPQLSAHPNGFVRPSPTRGTLGGVARRTRDAILLCEAAGYDVVLIETVGVGQSETAVGDMCDCFLLLAIPGAGDELQGMKRGVLEQVDVIAVNKADSGQESRAKIAANALSLTTHLMHRDSPPIAVTTCSAATGAGVDEVWRLIEQRMEWLRGEGRLEARRRKQDLRWLETLLAEQLAHLIERMPAAREALRLARQEVSEGRLTPAQAVAGVMRVVEGGLK